MDSRKCQSAVELGLIISQGNIGATEGGLPFLETRAIPQEIVRIAETSACLSIRG